MKKLTITAMTLAGLGSTIQASEPSTGTLIQLSVYALPAAVLLSVVWDWSRGFRRRKNSR